MIREPNSLNVFASNPRRWNKIGKICYGYQVWEGPSWLWSYGSWIYNYLCNQCPTPLMLWVRISTRVRCTTLCDEAYQWLPTGRWFSPGTPISSTNKTDSHDKHHQTNKQTNKQTSLREMDLSLFLNLILHYSGTINFNESYILQTIALSKHCLPGEWKVQFMHNQAWFTTHQYV